MDKHKSLLNTLIQLIEDNDMFMNFNILLVEINDMALLLN